MSKHKRMYSARLSDALQYAAELHASQKRKGKNGAPYLGHLLGTCAMVIENGGTEDEAIVAILHDSIEDRPHNGKTEKEIELSFGRHIVDVILELTHERYDGFKTQTELTDAYCRHLWEMSESALLIACADKIYNAQSVLDDYTRVGIGAFDAFKGGRDSVVYKYEQIARTIHNIIEKRGWSRIQFLSDQLLSVASRIEEAATLKQGDSCADKDGAR